MARPRILAVVCLLAATAAKAEPCADGGPAGAEPLHAHASCGSDQTGLASTPNEGVGKVALSGQPIESTSFARANKILIADIGDASRGLAYAQKNCAACHNVLPSSAPSPNPDAPPFRTVANTPGMTVTALTVWSRTSHPSMPNLVIEPHEMDDLIAHILGLRDRK